MKQYILVFLVSTLLFSSCKNEQKSSEPAAAVTETNNDSKELEKTGAKDISNVYSLKQDQFIPEYGNGFIFHSLKALEIYAKANGTLKDVDFENTHFIAIFAEKTNKKTSFKVDSYKTVGENTEIYLTSVWGEDMPQPYRPSYIFSVPKDQIKGYPFVRLDGKLLQLTTLE